VNIFLFCLFVNSYNICSVTQITINTTTSTANSISNTTLIELRSFFRSFYTVTFTAGSTVTFTDYGRCSSCCRSLCNRKAITITITRAIKVTVDAATATIVIGERGET